VELYIELFYAIIHTLFLIFADLLSLHLITFLMFIILVDSYIIMVKQFIMNIESTEH